VSADKRLLLNVFAHQQQENHDDACAILAKLVIEQAGVAACENAQRLVLSLAAAGKTLHTPPSAVVPNLSDYASARRSRYLH
jgi:hypothetical protein